MLRQYKPILEEAYLKGIYSVESSNIETDSPLLCFKYINNKIKRFEHFTMKTGNNHMLFF